VRAEEIGDPLSIAAVLGAELTVGLGFENAAGRRAVADFPEVDAASLTAAADGAQWRACQ